MTASQVPARPDKANKSATPTAAGRRDCAGSFETASQKHILRIAAGVPALEDLAGSFPALIYALATGYGTAEARAATIALVRQGAPLRHAAATIGLPWWLRRVPAAALNGSLAGLPADGEAARTLAAFVPADPVAARTWLGIVAYACRAAGAPFGAWLGSAVSRSQGALIPSGSDNLRLLAAWAWASGHRETALGGLVRRPWVPAAGIRRALEELIVWRQRMHLDLLLASRGPALGLKPGVSHGLSFVPLETASDYIAEAMAMDNCLDQYGERLAERRSHVVSIRRDGRPIADVEIGRHEEEETIAAIRQLRGQRNRRASVEIWRAAYAWLAAQPIGVSASSFAIDTRSRRAAAAKLWQPYVSDRAVHLTAGEMRDFSRMIGARCLSRGGGSRRKGEPGTRAPGAERAAHMLQAGPAGPCTAAVLRSRA